MHKFAFANDFRKSFTIYREYLTSHGLQMNLDSVCLVTQGHKIPGYQLLRIHMWSTKNDSN